MVLAGAGRHRAKELVIPANLRLASLPARSPELNPAEHLWEELREKWLGNQLFPHQQAVERQVEKGLAALEGNPQQVASLAGFHWIQKIPLTAR
jgi:putative transposase